VKKAVLAPSELEMDKMIDVDYSTRAKNQLFSSEKKWLQSNDFLNSARFQEV